MKKPKKKLSKPAKRTLKKIKAVCLMSGGLDSALAAKLVKDQGIEVYGICFTSPFFSKTSSFAEDISNQIGIDLKTVEVGEKYLKMLRKPKHGYGSALNPCTDCHTFMLKEAKAYAKKIGADFIITGEVLGQRPKSQQAEQLDIVEKESGLKGKLLRPLSARLLPRTDAEKKGLFDVNLFPVISGRTRNEQMALAKQMGIKRFSSPAGGCLLTCQEAAAKIRDVLRNNENAKLEDMEILKIGRHFRFGKSKIIVGKNYQENMRLMDMKKPGEYFFEAQEDIPSPITILQTSAKGTELEKALEKAAELTAYYSDAGKKKASIRYGKEKLDKSMKTVLLTDKDVDDLRITWNRNIKCKSNI